MKFFSIFRRRKKTAQQDTLSKDIVIVLDKRESEMFNRIKDKPVVSDKQVVVKKVSKDKQLPEAQGFRFDDNTTVRSIAELRSYVAGLGKEQFQQRVAPKLKNLCEWISSMFDQPVLAARVSIANSFEQFLETLDSFLQPFLEVEEQEFRDENFNRQLEELLEKYQDTKAAVREARKQGVRTLISETKLMNIKPKIEYAELEHDYNMLLAISKKLDEVMDELDEEKRLKNEEDEQNAIFRR